MFLVMDRSAIREGLDAATADSHVGGRSAPSLSIGLPVFNGARHLGEALDSLLAQDVGDLELIISDNASTDATGAICAEYASRDPRVRYLRNDVNMGAAANFNRVFELSSGDYFMWGSHDDLWEPSFARRCIEALERNPDAVLCTSKVAVIGDDGCLRAERYEPANTAGMPVDERIHDLIRRFPWYDVYSVIRPSALRRTGLYAPTYGGDVHLLMELTLLGEFITVPETLFRYRLPDVEKTAATQLADISVDRGSAEEVAAPATFLAKDLLDVIKRSDLDPAVVRDVEDDFIRTLSRKGSWGRVVLLERGVPPFPAWAARKGISAALGSRPISRLRSGAWRALHKLLSRGRASVLGLLRSRMRA